MQITIDDAQKILGAFLAKIGRVELTEGDILLCERILDAYPDLRYGWEGR